MLRDIIVNGANAAQANYKAAEALKTGMAVVKGTDGTVSAADVDADVFFVQKARIPTGANAAFTNLSDYFEEYNTVAQGDCVVLYKYMPGEQFAIDAFADEEDLDDFDNGDYVTFTNGLIATVSTGTSKYVYRGVYNDAGHKLAWLECVE